MIGTVRLMEWLEKHEQGSLEPVGSRSRGEGAVSFTHMRIYPVPPANNPGQGPRGGTENHKLIAKVLRAPCSGEERMRGSNREEGR